MMTKKNRVIAITALFLLGASVAWSAPDIQALRDSGVRQEYRLPDPGLDIRRLATYGQIGARFLSSVDSSSLFRSFQYLPLQGVARKNVQAVLSRFEKESRGKALFLAGGFWKLDVPRLEILRGNSRMVRWLKLLPLALEGGSRSFLKTGIFGLAAFYGIQKEARFLLPKAKDVLGGVQTPEAFQNKDRLSRFEEVTGGMDFFAVFPDGQNISLTLGKRANLGAETPT